MAATDQDDALVTTAAPRFSRRARVTTAMLVACGLIGVAWWFSGTPTIALGTVQVAGVSGYDTVQREQSGETFEVLQQNGDVGVFAFTVRNSGRVPTTVSVSDFMSGYPGWVGPRVRAGFAPADERLGLPASTEWSALDASATILPGAEAWVVVRTIYPEKCQATTSTDGSNGWYGYDSIRLVAKTLGRAVDVDVPLAYPVNIPIPGNTICTEADFVALDAAYPVR